MFYYFLEIADKITNRFSNPEVLYCACIPSIIKNQRFVKRLLLHFIYEGKPTGQASEKSFSFCYKEKSLIFKLPCTSIPWLSAMNREKCGAATYLKKEQLLAGCTHC